MLLKMSGLPYRTDTEGFNKAPKGKLPYIDDDGERIADSTFIRWHLEKKYNRFRSRAERRAARDRLGIREDGGGPPLLDAARCALDGRRQFRQRPGDFFRRFPAPLRPIVVAMVRRQVRKALHAHGMGRHSQPRSPRSGRARSTPSRTISERSRSSWAPSRPASTRPSSRSLQACCARL